jgi:hypothetical protein
MWLKLFTTAMMVFAVAILFLSGMIVGHKPPASSPRAEKIAYLRRSAVYVGAEGLSLIGALVGAWMIVRRAKADFRAHTEQNFKSLLEGTLRDHGKTTDGEQ